MSIYETAAAAAAGPARTETADVPSEKEIKKR